MSEIQPLVPPSSPKQPARAGIREILRDRAVIVIMVVAFVIMVGFGIVAPVLPLYALSFGVDYGEVGLLVSSFAIARLVFDPIAGPIVDRLGERIAASGGILVVALSSLLTGLAPTFTLAVVFRGFGGAGSAVLFASLFSYLLKVIPKERMARTSGLFFGAFNLGIIAGSPIGGAIAARFGLNAPLYAYAAVLVVAAVFYLRFVPDPRPVTRDEHERLGVRAAFARGIARAKALLRGRAFFVTCFINFAYLWMVASVYDTLLPLFADQRLGMSTAAIGGAFSVALATELASLYPAGSAADRVGRKPILLGSFVALAGLIAVTGLSPNPPVLIGVMALLGIASGVGGVVPTAMLSDITPDEGSGTSVGIYRFFGDLGFVFGPLIAGWSADGLGLTWAYAIAAVPIVAAIGLAAATPETMARRSA